MKKAKGKLGALLQNPFLRQRLSTRAPRCACAEILEERRKDHG